MARADSLFQIVQVNLQSDRGGDGRIVSDLHKRYRALGYPASLLVGRGTVTAEGEDLLRNEEYRPRWARVWLTLAQRNLTENAPSSKLARLSSWIAEPNRRLRIREGFEDFDFPATLPAISQSLGEGPTILHLHNLHGGYFDLRALPALSDLTPVILTLHDQWAFTGHCAHSFECERWRSGCGDCPDLTIYPGIPKDRTAENFALKRQIFSRTRLYLSSPSKWLMNRAEQSLLAPAIEEVRIIPNGVDTTVFRSGDKSIERSRLGLPRESRIVLSAGTVARSIHWTDRRLFHATLRYLAEHSLVDFTLLVLGSERSSQEKIDGIQSHPSAVRARCRESRPLLQGLRRLSTSRAGRHVSHDRPRIARLRSPCGRHECWRYYRAGQEPLGKQERERIAPEHGDWDPRGC